MDHNFGSVVYLLIGLAAFLAIEAALLALSSRLSYARAVNQRLRIAERGGDQGEILLQLRRKRSLTSDGRYVLPVIWLNRLVLQSGASLRVQWLLGLMVLVSLGSFAGLWQVQRSLPLALALSLIIGAGLPLLALKLQRRRRMRRFEEQLPDGVDVIVRSLRAGHPLPVAIAMVAREMPDPIGSEFGLTADELTYGLDLDTAMENLNARVGQEDLALVVVAISIQSRTGGNLSEILSNLSRVLRTRFKMRRRVKALSAEGRFSALALSVLPFLVFGALTLLAPSFYGDVWHEPATKKVLGVALAVMMFGNFVMYRMVNFRH